MADGQELSAHLGVSNTPESAYSVPCKVLGDSRREPGSKGMVCGFAIEPLKTYSLYSSAGGGINCVVITVSASIPTSDHHPSLQDILAVYSG